MELPITALFTGLLALWYVRLAIPLSLARHRAPGEALEQPRAGQLEKTHGNFAEYIPLLLFMMALLEWQGLTSWLLYFYGASILIGRYYHARGMRYSDRTHLTVGSVLTLWPLLLGAVLLVYVWVLQVLL